MPVFTHVLVPLDGSQLAEAVLPTALGLAAGLGARVTLLHVLERNAPDRVHGETHLNDVEQAERYLTGITSRYAGAGLEITYHVHANPENNVAASIAGHVLEFGADLVVLTPHGRTDLRRWLVGSIPQIVLQRGNTPVLFVPARKAGSGDSFSLRKLLVPVEGHAAEAVLHVAHQICQAFGAEEHILQVVPTLGTVRGDAAASSIFTPVSTAATLAMEEAAAHEYLSAQEKTWPTGIPRTVSVLRGEAVKTILDTIKTAKPDLTLMSTHGKSGLAGVWSASVTARVVARAHSPLLLMRVPQ